MFAILVCLKPTIMAELYILYTCQCCLRRYCRVMPLSSLLVFTLRVCLG